MSHPVDLNVAREKLEELVLSLQPGDEILLTQDGQTVARLTLPEKPERKGPVPGLGKGMLTIINDDDSHLEDFKDYM
jgi:antitoxin (DNA-binding transcriptional repressor) of toxin-antitoxin stability system